MYSEEQYLEDAEDMLRQPIINDQTRERRKKAFQGLAKSYISEEQIKNKGEFLGHFEERGFWGKGYLDVYEKAIIGRAENLRSGKQESFKLGVTWIISAILVEKELYLFLYDDRVYCFKHFKKAEEMEYSISLQVWKQYL